MRIFCGMISFRRSQGGRGVYFNLIGSERLVGFEPTQLLEQTCLGLWNRHLEVHYLNFRGFWFVFASVFEGKVY